MDFNITPTFDHLIQTASIVNTSGLLPLTLSSASSSASASASSLLTTSATTSTSSSSSSSSSSAAVASAFPTWLQQHPHLQQDQDASSTLVLSALSCGIPAVMYGVLTTTLIILFSWFWQLQRKIAYSDWVRNYKPSKLRNDTVTGAVRPPNVKGHFLLGNGRDFAKDAAGFLQRVGREYGDIATIRLMFRRIVVLNDVHSFPAFGREARFDFRPIVDQVNLNVFGFKVANVDDHKRRLLSFYKSSKMHDTVRLFDENLTKSMSAYDMDTQGRGHANANDFVIDTGFSAVFRTILGGDEQIANSKDYSLFYANYKKFMKYFNFLWLGLPLNMFPVASRALAEMVKVHPKVSGMPADEGVCGYLRKACEVMMAEGHRDSEIIGHNVEFIHVHINAVRLAYWMLLHTLSDSTAYQALLDEIDETVRQRRATSSDSDNNDNAVSLELEDVEGFTALDSIFTETLRLVGGVLVIRGVTQDVTMTTTSGKTYDLRRGETILFYPPAHHMDAEIFEEPRKFKWDRFIGATFSKNGQPIDKPVMGFGTLCIGQRFATYLAKWYLVRMVYRWRMELTAPVPEIDLAYQGHEILPPKCDTTIRFEPRPESYGTRLQIALSRSSSPDVCELEAVTTCRTTSIDPPSPYLISTSSSSS